MNLKDIEKIVKGTLSDKRFYHSVCVMNKCAELAKKYNIDVETAKKVGLAHDIAKEMTTEEKLAYISANNIKVEDIEVNNPGLLHAIIGADIVKKQFGFSEEMCNAIKYHSTAKEDMTLLEKIVYISDWCGDDRTFEEAKNIRNILVESDIDSAILYSFDVIIKEQLENRTEIHLNTIKARNFLLRR